jgi:hypothetical protein
MSVYSVVVVDVNSFVVVLGCNCLLFRLLLVTVSAVIFTVSPVAVIYCFRYCFLPFQLLLLFTVPVSAICFVLILLFQLVFTLVFSNFLLIPKKPNVFAWDTI